MAYRIKATYPGWNGGSRTITLDGEYDTASQAQEAIENELTEWQGKAALAISSDTLDGIALDYTDTYPAAYGNGAFANAGR